MIESSAGLRAPPLSLTYNAAQPLPSHPDVQGIPDRVWLYHLTRLEHLPGILRERQLRCVEALLREAIAPAHMSPTPVIARRRRVQVSAAPGGPLTEYVPLSLFRAPRWLAQEQALQARWVYLMTDLDTLHANHAHVVMTDGDPMASALTRFLPRGHTLNAIDWRADQRPPEGAPRDLDQPRRALAQALAYQAVPLQAILGLAVAQPEDERLVRQMLIQAQHIRPVIIRPDWFIP